MKAWYIPAALIVLIWHAMVVMTTWALTSKSSAENKAMASIAVSEANNSLRLYAACLAETSHCLESLEFTNQLMKTDPGPKPTVVRNGKRTKTAVGGGR